MRYPSLLRGLLFRLFSIHLIRLLVTSLKSVPFGIYCLIRPLVFSLIQRFIVSTGKIKLLLLQFSIGRIRMFGILFIITICHIATYTIKAFIASDVCFVLWQASRKNGMNLNCSRFLLNVFTSGQSVNLWQWGIITTLKARSNALNGGFQTKIPLNGLTKNNNQIFLIYENCKY